MKYYDPYYIKDPTQKKWTPVVSQGRTHSGRFNGNSILPSLTDDTFPIDSNGWSMYANGAWIALEKAIGDYDTFRPIADAILPDDVIGQFSHRMICEMVEAARDQAKIDNKDHIRIINAAHRYLTAKQYEIARTLLQEELAKDENAVVQSDILDKWFTENFDLIPEVEF